MTVVVDQTDRSLTGIVPARPHISVYDLAEIHQEVEVQSEYEVWRRWRYDHISVDFQRSTHQLAQAMWAAKRPWWMQF